MSSPNGEQDETDLQRAVRALDRGDLVVYPTETVYGLGGDALDPEVVRKVFAAKSRPPDRPISLAVPSVDAAQDYTRPTDQELTFMRSFLPGPVTVILERRSMVPDALTAGRNRVGVRVPDHGLALALLEGASPLTATSANRSGASSVRREDDLDTALRDAVAVVLDGGETPGTESTVVDVAAGEIHRHGARADTIERWLIEQA